MLEAISGIFSSSANNSTYQQNVHNISSNQMFSSSSTQQTSSSSPQSIHVSMSRGSTKKAATAVAPGSPLSPNRSSICYTPDKLSCSDAAVKELENKLKLKDSMISSLEIKVQRLEEENRIRALQSGNKFGAVGGEDINKRFHDISGMAHVISDLGATDVPLATRGSVKTATILDNICENSEEKTPSHALAEKFLQIFKNPVDYLPYLQSKVFAEDLIRLCGAASQVFDEEARCLFLQSPVYVIGDIHGNIEDLHFFSDNIWKMGMDLTAGQFLFLGDYVDRGMSGLECVAYLFGLKVLFPKKIHLLRGNHETRDVNGWEDHYKDKSFLYQCKERFGSILGEQVWEEINSTFDHLPLSAVIDRDIFCVHGGIPRPLKQHESEIHSVLSLPSAQGIMPNYDHEEDWMTQVASDCIWSDPAPESIERTLPASGFGDSPRGGGAVMFGSKAIENFLARNHLSYIIRAHEAHSNGVALSKGAKVFTVFSTSKDHRQGSRSMAGCILVDVDQIKVIVRSPKYSDKYVHRRTSLSVKGLASAEFEERRRLGLIRTSGADQDYFKIKKEREEEEMAMKDTVDKINNLALASDNGYCKENMMSHGNI